MSVALLLGAVLAAPQPDNLQELECAVKGFAFDYGVSRVPSAAQDLHDALRLTECPPAAGRKAPLMADSDIRQHRTAQHAPSPYEYYVSPSGSDFANGTLQDPFRTLHQARLAIHAARPTPAQHATVWLREGVYRLADTLTLSGPADSNTTWSAYGKESVTLSGAAALNLTWEAHAGGIMKAAVDPAVVRRAARPPPPHSPASQRPRCGDSNATCSWDSFQANTVYFSQDIKMVSATSAYDCCRQCQELAGCKGWTISNGIGGSCWLKGSVSAGDVKYQDAMVSGVAAGVPLPTPPTPPAHDWGPAPAVWNSLFVNGMRQVRARYPNANPQETSGLCVLKPQSPGEGCAGYATAGKQGETRMPPSRVAVKVGPLGPKRGDSPTQGCPECYLWPQFSYNVFDPPQGHPVYDTPLEGLGWGNLSYYTNNLESLAAAASFAKGDDTKDFSHWKNPSTGVVHMMHNSFWGNVQFQMSGYNSSSGEILLGYGGYQNRPISIDGNAFFVENIFEELDTPGEWFYDEAESVLYFQPNGSVADLQASDVSAPLLSTLVQVSDAEDVVFSGLEFTETRTTFMDQYQEPSGGWNVHRGAALFVKSSSRVTVSHCLFNQTGGNSILFSEGVTDSLIEANEIVLPGDSGVLLWGTAQGTFGINQTYPNRNVVRQNHIHEVGVYGKQTSCVQLILSANTTVVDNVCYNGPRAGLNRNDGFAGNDVYTGNLLFNLVRESADHGPFNSWDHQVFLTENGVDDGFSAEQKWGHGSASVVMQYNTIVKNFVINGYSGMWGLDHDDGSQYYIDRENFLVFGGCKNFQGNHKCSLDNLILYPGMDGRSDGDRLCQTDDNGLIPSLGAGFAEQYYEGNHCITADGLVYTYYLQNTTNVTAQVYHSSNNTFYSPGASFTQIQGTDKLNLAEWQALGQDAGSSVKETPSVDAIIAMAKSLLS